MTGSQSSRIAVSATASSADGGFSDDASGASCSIAMSACLPSVLHFKANG